MAATKVVCKGVWPKFNMVQLRVCAILIFFFFFYWDSGAGSDSCIITRKLRRTTEPSTVCFLVDSDIGFAWCSRSVIWMQHYSITHYLWFCERFSPEASVTFPHPAPTGKWLRKTRRKSRKKTKKNPVLTVLILDKQSACRLPSRQKGPNSILCVPLHKSLFLKNKQRFSSSARLLFQLKALVSSHGDTCGTSLKHISNKLHETKITSWPDQKQIPDLYMTPAYLPFIHMQTHLWKKITSNILTNTF